MRSVDIIVPCYNGGRFLGQTLESALSQTHPAVRVLVVDDGSTDDTRAVVGRHGGRVDYLAKANGGQASARNLGIGRTRGDYVLCLDADDLIAPDMVARLVTRLEQRRESDLAFASPLAFFGTDTGRGIPGHAYAETWRPEGPWPEYVAPLSFLCALHTSSTLVRRRAFDRHGLFPEDRAIQGCEDWYLWLKATLEGATIEHVEGRLTY
jgi:glycosyltransferase involved in cell wall biosynthesis